jgi:hypothetical protein
MSDDLKAAVERLRGMSEYSDRKRNPLRSSLLIDQREMLELFCSDLRLVLDALEGCVCRETAADYLARGYELEGDNE